MRTHFASILSCLLLLPGVGSGQGIYISNNSQTSRALAYESRYKLGEKYRFHNASIYTKNKVKKVELFRDRNNMPFTLTFDKQGRIIKSKNCGSDEYYTIITDSIFESDKTTVIDSFFEDNKLTRIDTLIINKVEIRRKKNKIIRYDKAFYKSYKSGAYLNDRNEYCKSLLNVVHPIYRKSYSASYHYDPPKRIDGNFDKYHRMYAEPGIKLILRREPYLIKKFYLAQTKTFYLNISDKSGNLYLRDKIRFFVQGEDFNQNCYYYKPEIGRPYCRVIQRWYPEPIEKQVQVINNKNLIDSVFTLTYYGQAKDKPCVKPKDSLFTEYLRGYSGEPEKEIQYYFRYEYFDE